MKTSVAIAALLVVGIGIFAFVLVANRDRLAGDIPAPSVHTDEVFGFSAAVPEGYTLSTYENHSATIGKADDEGNVLPAVELIVVEESADNPFDPFDSFDLFVAAALRNSCAADGPNESIACTDILSSDQFETSGAQGAEVTLREVHTSVGGEGANASTETTRGPWYVFNITKEASPTYAVLIVRTPLSAPEGDQTLLDTVAASVTVMPVSERATTMGFIAAPPVDSGDMITVEIDSARFLTGSIAIAVATNAGACAGEGEDGCLPNNFYIANSDTTTQTFVLPKSITVFLRTNPDGSGVATDESFVEVTPEAFVELVADTDSVYAKLPYEFTVQNGLISEIREVYVP